MHIGRITSRPVKHLLKRADSLELSHGAIRRLRWFLFALEHEGNISLTCRHFGIARSTFLRWAERFNPRDISSIEEYSRRPHAVREPETDTRIIECIRSIRMAEPLLGKEKVQELLRERLGMTVSVSTVGRVIARHRMFFANTSSHLRKRTEGMNAESESPVVSSTPRRTPSMRGLPMLPINPLAS